MRLVAVILFAVLLALPARAENAAPYSGTVSVATGKPFLAYVDALEAAVRANGFNMVGLACATCAAKSQGVSIPGNRVFLFFRPDLAVRMLDASWAAGIEAPIRLYVTEAGDGTAQVTYRKPSHVFGAYDVAALAPLGEELDGHVTKILADAVAGTR